jgi:ribosomal protein L29
MYLFWNDKEIGKYCITPLESMTREELEKMIKWLKKEMAGFTFPKVTHEMVKSYRGKKVEYIAKLEYIDCYKSGKSIHDYFYDLIQ